MAIIFDKSLPIGNVLHALNNNVIEFHSDYAELPLNAEITLDGYTTRIIYPSPNGKFYFNFKDYISNYLNTNNYADSLDFEISTVFYDWTNNVFTDKEIDVKINFVDATSETETINNDWLSSYVQKRYKYYNRDISSNGVYLLQTTDDISRRVENLYYWSGFPIDFTLLNTTDNEMYINTGFFNLNIPQITVNRCLLSDGSSVTDLNQYPLEIRNVVGNALVYTINIIEETPCDNGYYFKWINSLGGWSYWHFQHGTEQLKTKELGEIDQNVNDIQNTTSPMVQIGKTANDVINVYTDVLNERQSTQLRDLFDSPKIYLFTGIIGSTATFEDWIEVKLTNSNYTTKQAKTTTNQYNLTFEVPDNDTRKL